MNDGLDGELVSTCHQVDACHHIHIHVHVHVHVLCSDVVTYDALGIALTPLDYGEKDWVNDEFTRGCPVTNFSTGALWTSGHTLR